MVRLDIPVEIFRERAKKAVAGEKTPEDAADGFKDDLPF